MGRQTPITVPQLFHSCKQHRTRKVFGHNHSICAHFLVVINTVRHHGQRRRPGWLFKLHGWYENKDAAVVNFMVSVEAKIQLIVQWACISQKERQESISSRVSLSPYMDMHTSRSSNSAFWHFALWISAVNWDRASGPGERRRPRLWNLYKRIRVWFFELVLLISTRVSLHIFQLKTCQITKALIYITDCRVCMCRHGHTLESAKELRQSHWLRSIQHMCNWRKDQEMGTTMQLLATLRLWWMLAMAKWFRSNPGGQVEFQFVC